MTEFIVILILNGCMILWLLNYALLYTLISIAYCIIDWTCITDSPDWNINTLITKL